MFDYNEFRKDLIASEGYRTKPYTDAVGKLTVGVGFNLTDRGLPKDIIEELLRRDMETALVDCRQLLTSFDSLSHSRQRALGEMAFNLGRARLAGFRDMLGAIEHADFDRAAREALSSTWASQVGPRAQRIARALREG